LADLTLTRFQIFHVHCKVTRPAASVFRCCHWVFGCVTVQIQ